MKIAVTVEIQDGNNRRCKQASAEVDRIERPSFLEEEGSELSRIASIARTLFNEISYDFRQPKKSQPTK